LAKQSDSHFIVLTEGIADTLRCLDAGFSAVACFGCQLHEKQAGKLFALNKPIIIGFDADQEGQQGAFEIVMDYWKDSRISSLRPPSPYEDLGEMPGKCLTKVIATYWHVVYES
jgi:DNA primase